MSSGVRFACGVNDASVGKIDVKIGGVVFIWSDEHCAPHCESKLGEVVKKAIP